MRLELLLFSLFFFAVKMAKSVSNATSVEMEENTEFEEEMDKTTTSTFRLPRMYDLSYVVRQYCNVSKGEEETIIHNVLEQHLGRDQVRIVVRPQGESKIECLFSKITGFGHKIEGLSCLPAVNLPSACLPQGVPLLSAVVARNSNAKTNFNNDNNMKSDEVVKTVVMEASLSTRTVMMLVHKTIPLPRWQPLSLSLQEKKEHCIGNSSCVSNWVTSVQYELESVSSSSEQRLIRDTLAIADIEGIFCPRPDIYRKRLPDLPKLMHAHVETHVDSSNVGIEYNEVSVDAEHSLLALDKSMVVEEEKLFVVNDKCRIDDIDNYEILRPLMKLMDVDVSAFMYSGQRVVRGVLCDVWVSEQKHSSAYETTEMIFSSGNQLLKAISVYKANSTKDQAFSRTITSHFFNTSKLAPIDYERKFDLSNCLPDRKRLFLRLSIDVSMKEVVDADHATVLNTLRVTIAKLAEVSVLRVVDLSMAFEPDSKRPLWVWFVLLDALGSTKAPNKHSLQDAYHILGQKVAARDIEVDIDLGRGRQLRSNVVRHSLYISHHVSPSYTSKDSIHSLYLRAHYTAGSMVSLAFSMAVLGLSMGLFMGFLLWKRRIGMPSDYGRRHFNSNRQSASTNGISDYNNSPGFVQDDLPLSAYANAVFDAPPRY